MKTKISFTRLSFLKKNFGGPKVVSLTFGILVICFAVGFYIFAWVEPPAEAPTGNVPAPLNTSNIEQIKVGGLILNTGGAQVGLAVDKGKVGIGILSPGARLEIDMKDLTTTEGLHISRDAAASHYAYLNIEDENGGPVFNIHESGKVGIGTLVSDEKLKVAGSIKATGIGTFNGVTSTGNLQFEVGGSPYGVFYFSGSDLIIENLVNGGDINMSIVNGIFNLIMSDLETTGTGIFGNARITELVSCDTIDTDASGNLVCGADAGGGSGLWTDSGTYIYPNNYNQFVITDNGEVGIGTTSPQTNLHVKQPSTTGTKPVLTVEQNSTEEGFIKYIGTSETHTESTLVYPGEVSDVNIEGYLKVYIQDDAGIISSGYYYIPFYGIW